MNNKEKKLIIIALETCHAEMDLSKVGLIYKLTMNKEWIKCLISSRVKYEKLIKKLRSEWKLKDKLYLDKV